MYQLNPPFKIDLPVPERYRTKNFIAKNKEIRSQSVQPIQRNRAVEKDRHGKKLDKITALHRVSHDIENISTYLQDYNNPGLSQISGDASGEADRKNVTASGSRGSKVRLQPLPHRSMQLAAITDRNNETTGQGNNENPESSNFGDSPEGPKRYTRSNWQPRFEVGKKHSSSVPSINFKGTKASLYARDFVTHDLKDIGPIHKPDLWKTYRSNYPMDGKTIHKVSSSNHRLISDLSS